MGIIIKPLITEKMTAITEKNPQRYAFLVDPRANKLEIKDAVEAMYNVKVKSVNTLNREGKDRSRYTKGGLVKGRTNAIKKAIVTLAEDQTIDFFANI